MAGSDRRRRLLTGSLGALALGATAAVALTELAFHRQGTGPGLPGSGRGAVVVLGVPGTNPALRAVRRWRIDLALGAWRTGRIDRVVFTGGAVRSARSEAAEMAELAIGQGLDPAVVALDETSTSTWENVVAASALVGQVDFVVLASDAFHAARARVYWWDQHGAEDSPQLVLADRYRPFDHLTLRVPVTAFELAHRLSRRGWLPWPPTRQ